MGMCLPCLSGAEDDVVVTPDPETRRRQLAEAAEKRQKERFKAKHRGAKAARSPTEASKTQKPWRGKRRNKKRQRNRL
ncbi:small VCP/p97-interacting protein-like isoform X2 [Carassius carassius]|uniref:small VCP/p97-interacting protein-like isoform X2 n=1 Tax=Carassius carassius TaxID=217509 RepID=UPI00286895AC|nr:small VCP/p97-interacting protein-like isoform X2 [Carassius carassius]